MLAFGHRPEFLRVSPLINA